MKRLMLVAILGIFYSSSSVNAGALQNFSSRVGQSMDNITLPLLGKLTDIMPFGLVATSFKEYPKQTMIVLAGLLAYALSYNQSVRELFEKYKETYFSCFGTKKNNHADYDETLFIFDGEDADDAEDEMEIEDELLDEDLLFDKKNNDVLREKEVSKQTPIIKFL